MCACLTQVGEATCLGSESTACKGSRLAIASEACLTLPSEVRGGNIPTSGMEKLRHRAGKGFLFKAMAD